MKRKLLYFFGTLTLLFAVVLGAFQAGKNVALLPAEDTDFNPTFGWVYDEDATKENLNPNKTLQFSNTPAGKALLDGDTDVYLWRVLRKAAGKSPEEDWYSNINQGETGSCVGAGFKHSVDVLLAVQITEGKLEEFKPVSAEAIYALSRVEIGGGVLVGDGSTGGWASKAVSRYGVLAMQPYSNIDLSTYSATRARQLGKTGLSTELENIAKQHPVNGTALVTSWEEAKKAIRQGYPIPLCSNQGFSMARDSSGTARAQGKWAHCMSLQGIRFSPREQGFIVNSWGDRAHTGPRVPVDAPVCGFWADAAVIDRMLKQGDSFALSDVVGFPQRKLPFDWFIHHNNNKFNLLNKFEVAFND
jgi:hypothetical protein